MTSHPPAGITEQMLHRIYSEYLEMPGLGLTRQQAQRLWGLDAQTCARSLEYLVEAGFLARTPAYTYRRVTEGPTPFPQPRMAKSRLESQGDRQSRARA